LLSTAAFAADLNARTAHTVQEENTMYLQARRQDLAARGPKTRRRGQKPEGGHIFKIQYWMYAATSWPKVKWGGTDFKWGARATLPPPLATTLCIRQINTALETRACFDKTLTLGQLPELSACT